MARPRSAASSSNGANLGFEAGLWAAADALRNNMDAGDDSVMLPALPRFATLLAVPSQLGGQHE